MAPSAWNNLVKQTFHEGRKSNPNYSFKQALVDASAKKKRGLGMSKSKSKSKSRRRTKSKRSRSRSRR